MRIIVNLSKKLPVYGVDYSSQNFSVGLEQDIDGALSEGEMKLAIEELNRIANDCINEQVSKADAEARAKAVTAQPAQVAAPSAPLPFGGPAVAAQPVYAAPAAQPAYAQPVAQPVAAAPMANGNGNGYAANGNGNGVSRMASPKQINAVYAVSRDAGYTRDQLVREIQQRFGVGTVEGLQAEQASLLIDYFRSVRR